MSAEYRLPAYSAVRRPARVPARTTHMPAGSASVAVPEASAVALVTERLSVSYAVTTVRGGAPVSVAAPPGAGLGKRVSWEVGRWESPRGKSQQVRKRTSWPVAQVQFSAKMQYKTPFVQDWQKFAPVLGRKRGAL